MITLAIGLILTAAFAALAIGRLNLISVTFAVLFVGLGVDFGIHLALRYREARAEDDDHRGAIGAAIRGVGGPLSLSALCAALGFLAFVPTDYQGLAELGIISAAGMVIAWLASLTLLPALLGIMRADAPPAWLERASPPRRASSRGRAPWSPRARCWPPSPARLAADRVRLQSVAPQGPGERIGAHLPRARGGPRDLGRRRRGAGRRASRKPMRSRPGSRASTRSAGSLTLSSFVPDEQEAKLALIDELAFLIGPLLEPGAAAPPPDDAARQVALARLQASAAAAAAHEGNPGARRLAEELARFQEVATPAARAELERRLLGTLPALLARLRQALGAGPVTLADLPASLRARWLNAAGQARVVAAPAAPLTDNAALAAFAEAVLAVAPQATGTPIIVTGAGAAVIDAFRRHPGWRSA